MPATDSTGPARRWLVSKAFTLLVLGPAASLWAADGQKQVLVLYETRRDAQIAVVGDREIPRILEGSLKEGVDYYSEHIEVARFSDANYEDAYRDFLRLKYKGHVFDIVIGIGDVSVDFLAGNRNELFPKTPIVFFADDPDSRRVANSTGVIAGQDFSRTVAFALELQPDTRNVFVVTGAGMGDQAYENRARDQLRSFEPQLTITYLSGLATRELEARLAALPPDSIVLYLLVSRDGAGENFHPLEYVDRVAAAASVPTYSWVNSAIGHGIVGGSLKDQQVEAVAIANLALRVLRGEPAHSIPLSEPDLNVPQVDWRQLRRWGIREARIPAGTRVLFREATIWERYQMYILGATGLLLAQTALIAALLVQRARRRQAEEQAHGSQAELRTSSNRIRDLAGRLLNAQEAERSRIARELHDDVGQQVTLLAIDLDLLSHECSQQPALAQMAEAAYAHAQSIARSMHNLSHQLHPAKLHLMGVVAAIEGLGRDLSQPNLGITFTHHNVPIFLPQDLTLCLFRIVQEATGNAIKHSGAVEVSVRLSGDADGLALTIVDDGVGFDVDAAWSSGLGLVGMVERLESIGGKLNIHSAPGMGTRIEVTVPWSAAAVKPTLAS